MDVRDFYRVEKFRVKTSEVFLLGGAIVVSLGMFLVRELLLLEMDTWKLMIVFGLYAYAASRAWIDLIGFLRRKGIVEK